MHIHEEQQYREKKRATIVQTIFYGEIKVENKKKKKKGKNNVLQTIYPYSILDKHAKNGCSYTTITLKMRWFACANAYTKYNQSARSLGRSLARSFRFGRDFADFQIAQLVELIR